MKTALFFIASVVIAGCGAKSDGIRHAEVIPSADGSRCYAIIDTDGSVKGGSCK